MQAWNIDLRDLVVGYDRHIVLRDVNALIPAGKITVILGGSGCGKSTLLRHIAGLQRPISGEILINGRNLNSLSKGDFRRLRRRMGVLFQDGALLGSLTLAENAGLPLSQHLWLKKELLREAELRVLKMVDLADFADFYPNELSGGMRKRAGLARAIIADPAILLCDEPTSGLDPITAARMDELLLSMHDQYKEMTIVVVSHDLASLKRVAQNVLVLGDGRALFSGSLEELLASDDPYLQDFLNRRPEEGSLFQDEPPNPEVARAVQKWLDS